MKKIEESFFDTSVCLGNPNENIIYREHNKKFEGTTGIVFQIIAIKKCKKINKKNWNNISFAELFNLVSELSKTFNILKRNSIEDENDKLIYEWFKTLIKYMNKNKLIGKNMNSFKGSIWDDNFMGLLQQKYGNLF